MKNLRWALSGFALGLVLALAPSCGPVSGKCGPSNCSGCCTADGKCELGTLTNACGLNASVCAVCGPADQCQGGFCRPITGSQKDGGSGGNDGGPGNDDGGTDAGMDAGSDAGTCNSSTCANGCCDLNGECVVQADQSSLQCGSGGAACTTCTGSLVCNKVDGTTGGFCQDTSCAGCVKNGVCQLGTSESACGTGGVTCDACGSGQTCTGGVCTGGTTCDSSTCPNGCCSNGSCVTNVNSGACGSGGQACAPCGFGQTCVANGSGGFCQGTTTASVGSTCTSNSDCSALGVGATCRQFTATGNASYQGGYCTVECDGSTTCPNAATCLNWVPWGESPVCSQACNVNTGGCRTGYTCYELDSTTGDGACWLDPLPTPPTAPSNLVGSSCSADSTCQNGGNLLSGFCFAALDSNSMSTGWTNGYCSAECAVDPMTICGSTGICLGFQNTSGDQFSLCMDKCTAGGVGQSDCRTGYVCKQYAIDSNGTLSSDGYCWPNCNNVAGSCATGKTCQTSGYCQ